MAGKESRSEYQISPFASLDRRPLLGRRRRRLRQRPIDPLVLRVDQWTMRAVLIPGSEGECEQLPYAKALPRRVHGRRVGE